MGEVSKQQKSCQCGPNYRNWWWKRKKGVLRWPRVTAGDWQLLLPSLLPWSPWANIGPLLVCVMYGKNENKMFWHRYATAESCQQASHGCVHTGCERQATTVAGFNFVYIADSWCFTHASAIFCSFFGCFPLQTDKRVCLSVCLSVKLTTGLYTSYCILMLTINSVSQWVNE